MAVAGEGFIGLHSLLAPAADPQGANAVREDLKGIIQFILGTFSGIITNHAVQAVWGGPKP